MSGLFGSITIKGNRLTDLVGQTSTVGKPIPFGYGRVRVEEANVIWTAGIPKEHVKKKKQGKGGVKTEEYTYTLSYAIAFMAGPVYGFLTIKRGGKVVYTTDPNASVDDRAFAAKWLQKARLYLGTEAQMPDATIESYKGAGKVSAFRGLCYIVVTDDDVTGEGGAVPQYEAIIIATPPDIYLTSKPYPNDMAPEALSPALTLYGGTMRQQLWKGYSLDSLDPSLMLPWGEFKTPLVRWYFEPHALDTTFALLPGQMKSPLQKLPFVAESLNPGLPTLRPGTMAVKLVKYTYWPAESLIPTLTLPAGGYLGA